MAKSRLGTNPWLKSTDNKSSFLDDNSSRVQVQEQVPVHEHVQVHVQEPVHTPVQKEVQDVVQVQVHVLDAKPPVPKLVKNVQCHFMLPLELDEWAKEQALVWNVNKSDVFRWCIMYGKAKAEEMNNSLRPPSKQPL